MNTNPIIIHIASLLEKASEEQLRIIYQVIQAMLKPNT